MSILLIGQRNRYYSSQKPKFLDFQEAEEFKRAKKNVQDQYRKELIEQMNDSYERKRKQRERQKTIDMKYEKAFYEQIAEYQQRFGVENSSNSFTHKRNQSQGGIPRNSVRPPRKQYQLTLPTVNNQFNSKRTKIARLQTEPVHTSFTAKPLQRISTNLQRNEQSYNGRDDQRWQSVELRQKKLHDDLQMKLRQVYQLMAHSVKQFNNESYQLQKIGGRLGPIRLPAQKQYKVKYPQPLNPQYTPQLKQDYYKLPNINQDYKQRPRTPVYQDEQDNGPVKQSQKEWREWYAKEKLRELETRYMKELDLEASQVRLFNRRVPTPKFRTQISND